VKFLLATLCSQFDIHTFSSLIANEAANVDGLGWATNHRR